MAQPDIQTAARELADAIQAVDRIVVFTGAGISTESGISDYRSQGGLWERYKPVTIQEFLAGEDARRRYWQRKKDIYPTFAKAKPNAGHRAIAALERVGRLQVLITQNIDGLHEIAGNDPENIIELHGTERWVKCLACEKRIPRAEVQERLEAGEEVPLCKCGGWLKPATISFGQSLPEDILARAFEESENCEAFLVVGSSLLVQPAALMPGVAKHAGAWLGILNRDETPFDDVADWRVNGEAGPVLEAAMPYLLAT